MRFSIIIPAFNAEKRIWNILSSIYEQTFKDFEIIVVCDACKDGTAEIAKAYGARVFEIDAHNSADARNKGLDEAQGEYILFADDDDHWIHPYALEQMDREIKHAGDQMPDMVQCAFVWGKRGVTPVTENINPAVWNKIWKRSAIGDTRFPRDAFPAEDLAFTTAMIRKPNIKIGFAPLLWYYYDYLRKGSISEQRGETL